LLYPAYLSDNDLTVPADIPVADQTPPAFVAQTLDDKSHVNSAIAYSLALKRHGVPVELHIFQKGGHGYGLRKTANPVCGWPSLCDGWLRANGHIPGG
jgi:acetyl esterase/lipase